MTRITIAHAPTCPVNQPDFKLPTKPDGTVDMEQSIKNPQCNCDFMKRFKAYVNSTDD